MGWNKDKAHSLLSTIILRQNRKPSLKRRERIKEAEEENRKNKGKLALYYHQLVHLRAPSAIRKLSMSFLAWYPANANSVMG